MNRHLPQLLLGIRQLSISDPLRFLEDVNVLHNSLVLFGTKLRAFPIALMKVRLYFLEVEFEFGDTVFGVSDVSRVAGSGLFEVNALRRFRIELFSHAFHLTNPRCLFPLDLQKGILEVLMLRLSSGNLALEILQ